MRQSLFYRFVAKVTLMVCLASLHKSAQCLCIWLVGDSYRSIERQPEGRGEGPGCTGPLVLLLTDCIVCWVSKIHAPHSAKQISSCSHQVLCQWERQTVLLAPVLAQRQQVLSFTRWKDLYLETNSRTPARVVSLVCKVLEGGLHNADNAACALSVCTEMGRCVHVWIKQVGLHRSSILQLRGQAQGKPKPWCHTERNSDET